MNLKILLSYVMKFVIIVLLYLLILLCLVEYKFGSETYLLNVFEGQKYYDKLYESIRDEMENYIIQSGLPSSVLDNIFTKDDIKEEVKGLVLSIYSYTTHTIDTSFVKEKLNKNIDSYLAHNNIVVTDRKSLDNFVSEIAKLYFSEINLYGSFNMFSRVLMKINKYLVPAILIISVLLVLSILVLKYYVKEKRFSSIFFTVAMLFLGSLIFVQNKMDINHIYLFSSFFSDVIKTIYYNISSKIIFVIIILFVIGIILPFINLIKKKKYL